METYTVNNGNFSKTHPKKPRKTATFSNNTLHKIDVGEFKDGYFVVTEATKDNQLHNKNKNKNKSTGRILERSKSDVIPRPLVQQPSAKDLTPNPLYSRPEGDNNVAQGRLASPSHSPNKSRRHSPNSQPVHSNTSSPNKPRKAYHEKPVDRSESFPIPSSSPPKDKGPSPTSSRWAGPAFSNAPPPSSLPIPDFPPFAPPQSPPTSPAHPQVIPSTSNILAQSPHSHQEAYFYAPLAYSQIPQPHTIYFPNPFPYAPVPSLDQLSLDLRRMLHINEQPIPAIPA